MTRGGRVDAAGRSRRRRGAVAPAPRSGRVDAAGIVDAAAPQHLALAQVKDWRSGHAAACKKLRADLDAAARVRVDLNQNPLQGAAVMPTIHL